MTDEKEDNGIVVVKDEGSAMKLSIPLDKTTREIIQKLAIDKMSSAPDLAEMIEIAVNKRMDKIFTEKNTLQLVNNAIEISMSKLDLGTRSSFSFSKDEKISIESYIKLAVNSEVRKKVDAIVKAFLERNLKDENVKKIDPDFNPSNFK